MGKYTNAQRTLGYRTPWTDALSEAMFLRQPPGLVEAFVATSGTAHDYQEAFRIRRTRRKTQKAIRRVIRRLRAAGAK